MFWDATRTRFASLGFIASAVLLNHDPKSTWVAVCITYIDASGSPKDPNSRAMCLAGYVATEARWTAFEKKWNEILRREGLSFFHNKDFAHFRREFKKGWREDEQRRRKLLRDLIRVTKRYVRKAFSSGILLDDYDDVDREYEFHEHAARPYGLLASAMMVKVDKWLKRTHPGDEVLFVFEKGDANQEEVDRLVAESDGAFGHPPLFLPKKWKNKKGDTCYRRPFEACDFIAYEHRSVLASLGVTDEPRGSLEHLGDQIPGAAEGMGYNKKRLVRMCRTMRIPKRRS